MEPEHASAGTGAGRTYVVFLGKVQLKYEQAIVRASRILEDGGATPVEGFVLEALVGASGKPEDQFKPTDDVDLSEPHRKHFRAVPSGGGRA